MAKTCCYTVPKEGDYGGEVDMAIDKARENMLYSKCVLFNREALDVESGDI